MSDWMRPIDQGKLSRFAVMQRRGSSSGSAILNEPLSVGAKHHPLAEQRGFLLLRSGDASLWDLRSARFGYRDDRPPEACSRPARTPDTRRRKRPHLPRLLE